MTRLAVLLRDHCGPLEADLHREYGIDLRGFWRGDLTPRYLLVRIDALSPGAALWRALKVDAAWTPEAHLLATAVDALNGANWQRAGSKGPAPKPISRPSDHAAAAQRDLRNRAQAARFLARQQARDTQGGGSS